MKNGQKTDNKFTPFWIKFVKIAQIGAISSILSVSNLGKETKIKKKFYSLKSQNRENSQKIEKYFYSTLVSTS